MRCACYHRGVSTSDVPPSSERRANEELALAEDREEARARIARAYELAWHAVQLARRYAAEPQTQGSRENACIVRVMELRRFIRSQRQVLRALHTDASELRPGLRKAVSPERTYEIRFTKKLSY